MIINAGKGFKEVLFTVLNATEKVTASVSEGKTPPRMMARVLNIKGDTALLKWTGGTFSARLETPVIKGEHLLLEFCHRKNRHSYYRILARSQLQTEDAVPVKTTQTGSLLWSFLFSGPGNVFSYPVITRMFYPGREKGEHFDRDSSCLEMIVDTENLGLIMIRLGIDRGEISCIFMVESVETGQALEAEASRMRESHEKPLLPGNGKFSWSVFPVRGNLVDRVVVYETGLLDTMA